jgi:hypothetical protein
MFMSRQAEFYVANDEKDRLEKEEAPPSEHAHEESGCQHKADPPIVFKRHISEERATFSPISDPTIRLPQQTKNRCAVGVPIPHSRRVQGVSLNVLYL